MNGIGFLYNPNTPNHVYNDFLFPSVAHGFKVVGSPDLDGDGHADFLFENRTTGDSSYVLLNGLTPGASGYLFRNVDRNYHLVGTPDLNHDAHELRVPAQGTAYRLRYRRLQLNGRVGAKRLHAFFGCWLAQRSKSEIRNGTLAVS